VCTKDIANWTNFEVNPEPKRRVRFRALASERRDEGIDWNTMASLKLVSDLAAEFEASLTATIRKYCEVAAHSCAGVWYKARVSAGFPLWQFPALDQSRRRGGCRLLDCNTPIEEMTEVRASEWIPAFSENKESTLLQDV